MKKKNGGLFIEIIFVGILSSLLLSCGYSFAPAGDYIDKRIQKIYIESFENKTATAEIENYVRSAFIDQLILTSRFRLADNKEAADATVKGSVLTLVTAPLSYRGTALAAEERATMILEVTFREKESGRVIWSTKGISGTVDYTVSSDINQLPATRKTAYQKLAADTAEKTFNQMMSNF